MNLIIGAAAVRAEITSILMLVEHHFWSRWWKNVLARGLRIKHERAKTTWLDIVTFPMEIQLSTALFLCARAIRSNDNFFEFTNIFVPKKKQFDWFTYVRSDIEWHILYKLNAFHRLNVLILSSYCIFGHNRGMSLNGDTRQQLIIRKCLDFRLIDWYSLCIPLILCNNRELVSNSHKQREYLMHTQCVTRTLGCFGIQSSCYIHTIYVWNKKATPISRYR